MPRPICEYTLADWVRLRPVTHALKSWRYDAVNRVYVRWPARAGDRAAIARTIAGRNVLVTIAFNDPEAIGWQAPLVRHYVPSALHIIADNSSDESAARAIMEVARAASWRICACQKTPGRHLAAPMASL